MLSAIPYILAASFSFAGVQAGLPSKVYGVNLGSWLVLEPWMLPNEWASMGGQTCDDCSTCIASEFAMAKAFPDTVDAKFAKHWSTWFTGDDATQLASLGINTVRIPLGYWIVEDLVNRKTEFYPRGGMAQLKRGLVQLKNAGIVAILDHHALPGVQTPGQQFTGRCTSDVEFYTTSNYNRALTWTTVMASMSHLDPDFSNVVAIEAVNEPIMNANQTPGYGDFQKNFVQAVRAVEEGLGISSSSERSKGNGIDLGQALNFTTVLEIMATKSEFNVEVRAALRAAVPIITKLAVDLEMESVFNTSPKNQASTEPLITTFMDINWQNNNPSNPADAADGPQVYDNHLYYSFGGVADANEDAYMRSICNLNRISADAAKGNSPLLFGEWGLPTQFSASDAFLRKWADAQKLQYSKGAGWVFWNFKTESGNARQWSYVEGVKRGYFTKDPSKLNDPNVCAPYIN